MRPLPEDILRQLRRILDEVIRPDLTDQFACEQAELMSALLEHLRLRATEEMSLLVEDSADVRGVLEAALPAGRLRARLAEIPPGEATADVSVARATNDALHRVLAEAIEHLEESAPDGDGISRIRALLRRNLDRERRIIGPGYALGT